MLRKGKKTGKRKKHFSDYIVAAAICAVAVYTAAAVILQFCGLAEISASLTACWFSFWTAEIAALAAIKGGKVRHGDKNSGKNAEKSADKEL